MKLVPRSHLNGDAGPRRAKNHLSAQMNELASIDSNTSMCMALLLKQVNTRPQRFEFAAPPLVFLVTTVQGPNASKPTLLNGAAGSIRSRDGSDRVCSNVVPRNILQLKQLYRTLATKRSPPTNQ